MAGPLWLRAALAVLMIVIALGCAARLCFARGAHLGRDGLRAATGVAMAGMLVPAFTVLPAAAWEAVFGLAGGWFGWQAIRTPAPGTGPQPDTPLLCLLECAAMGYMLLAATGGFGPPAIALLLALCMIGSVVWTADTAVRASAESVLAPRLSAAGKIAMGITMGYMLFQMA